MPTASAVTEAKTALIDLAAIDLPPDARQHTPEKLEKLVNDMQKQGQLQEIVVTPTTPGRYEVLAGVGRILAARILNWTQIRASIRAGLSGFDKARITFAENEAREDVDPFYQAAQLQKMMQAGGIKSQKKLAEALDEEESYVSRYLGLMALSADVQKKLQRCNFSLGQLVQILRVSTSSEILAAAEVCKKQDLSVRALTAWVDKKLGKGSGKTPLQKPREDMNDPLAELWEPLQKQAMMTGKPWGVTYGPKPIPTLNGVAMPAWQFWVVNNGLIPRADLKRWAQQIVDAMGDTREEASDA